MTIKMPVELWQRIQDLAQKEDRTASATVRVYLRKAFGIEGEQEDNEP